MDHWEERSKDEAVVEGVEMMNKFFKEKLLMTDLALEEIQHAYGVLKTNAVGFMNGKGQALYPIVCIMSHSCTANLEPVEDPSSTITFRAKRTIKQGEELSMRYLDFLDSRHSIQQRTQKEWIFQCNCKRCSDPTEFESNFSSFQCACGGFFYKQDPHQQSQQWVCSVCLRVEDLSENYKTTDKLIRNLDNENDESILDILKLDGCHRNFYLTTKCFMKFIERNKSADDLEILEKVVDMAKCVISTLSQLDPGCTRMNGKYLMILMTSQHKLMMLKNQEYKVAAKDMKGAVMEITKGKLQAAKMMSPFSIAI